ncbi:universal stress protein [Methanohalophilus halophilus]|uniref:Universal stress protein n=1 Tax=Methanohalophilus halophilus TaxID=2177 RepID=A0A1L3PZM5_9EURY|nr:universal stress protein [Methanohalophilus halophilus]APH38049.1 universal stress protein [Methanohalophilus halophilus]RNI07285.1 universal stress protein [Methanohalophilus halophilus]SDW84995.1 Nucleotide-binding universal stress protein, UspA family [Methanohalophilus halophilus]
MSTKIEKIMIATDGSENVKNAVSWGIELAEATGAKVKAVYVLPPVSVSIATRGERWADSLRNHLKDEGKSATEYVVETGKKADVEVEPLIIEGNPADGIVKFATENGIDLIVMGTLGRTGISHLLLGSVAENVVRHSKTQVLVVP